MSGSIFENPKFKNSPNGKLLESVLNAQKEEQDSPKRRDIALTEDVVILREMSNYGPAYYDEAYRKIGKQLKLDPARVKQRYTYLNKHNAKIEKNPDGTVKRISLSGLRHNKIKREIESKTIEAIEVRCDVIESLMEKNLPATILAIVKVTKALDPADLQMFLWEIIKANKECSTKIVSEFMERELIDELINGREL
jgi:hypothetical protein